MANNKFILRLKGTKTAASVVEVKDDKITSPFANMPFGSSDTIDGIMDDTGSSVVVAKGAQNWAVGQPYLINTEQLERFGDGRDYRTESQVSGAGMWINSSYEFPPTGSEAQPVAQVFLANSKWVLKLCGKNLLTTSGETIEFTFVVKVGPNNIASKVINVPRQANFFCKKFVVDFSESAKEYIAAYGGTDLTLQLFCSDENASATIFWNMSTLTLLERKVDATAVASKTRVLDTVFDEGLLPSEYFSNGNFIDQLEDNGTASPIFKRDGAQMKLDGWDVSPYVKDIVDTTADLSTYPISANHIKNDDVIIVLNDSDAAGATTYRRYHNGAWVLKGVLCKTEIDALKALIPDAASPTNQLADKAFVNSSVQTATANFRGNWATWADVPTSAGAYPVDYAGSKTPTVNDYLVVADASGFPGQTLVGTWRFKYSGTWATNGKNGWLPEYQVNEEPLTMAQLAALNSGVSAALLDDMQADIDRVDGKTAELDGDLQGKVDKAQGAANVGKFLKVGADGNVMLGDVDTGVTEVAHDDTLTGKGTTEEPLSVAKPKIILRRW